MTAKLFSAAGIVAAGLLLAACQTTDGAINPVSVEARACQDFGLTPGTDEYTECVIAVRDDVRDYVREIERRYDFPVDIDCEVEYITGEWYIVCDVEAK